MQNDSSSLLKTTLQNAATTASVIPGVSTPSCFRVTCMDWARRVTVLLYTVLDGDRAALRDVGLAAGRKGFLLAALFAGGRSRRVHDLKPCPRSPSRAWFNVRSIDSHLVISGNVKALVSKAFATVAESSGFCNPQKTVNDPHKRRGRAIAPDSLQRMGLRLTIRKLPGAKCQAAPLPGDRYPSQRALNP